MDLKDTAAVRQVWQRVGLVSAAEKGISLRVLIGQEWDLMVFCRKAAPDLARQASQRADRVRALDYVQTGQTVNRPCPGKADMARSAPVLRQKIRAAQELHRAYTKPEPEWELDSQTAARFAAQTDYAVRYLLAMLSALV